MKTVAEMNEGVLIEHQIQGVQGGGFACSLNLSLTEAVFSNPL